MMQGLGTGFVILVAVMALVVAVVAVAVGFRRPPMVREARRKQREWDKWAKGHPVVQIRKPVDHEVTDRWLPMPKEEPWP